MDGIKTVISSASAQAPGPGQLLKSWQVGQLLQARVLTAPRHGQVLLGIAGHKISAKTDVAVQSGAVLKLQVNGLLPAPSLRILTPPAVNSTLLNPIQGQVQLLLPRQGSVTAPLATLLDSAQRVNILSLLGLKSDELKELEKNVGRFEHLADLKSLQKAILQSGLFFESDLLQLARGGPAIPSGDLKALLFSLLQKINRGVERGSQPADQLLLRLRGEVEGALATITLNQLTARQVHDPDGGIWLFDMPFRIRDALGGLSISAKWSSAADNAEEREWRVLISVSLPKLGAVEAELFLRGSRVSVVIYAARQQTQQWLDAHLYELQWSLQKYGLQVAVLRCQSGGSNRGKLSAQWRECVDVMA